MFAYTRLVFILTRDIETVISYSIPPLRDSSDSDISIPDAICPSACSDIDNSLPFPSAFKVA